MTVKKFYGRQIMFLYHAFHNIKKLSIIIKTIVIDQKTEIFGGII